MDSSNLPLELLGPHFARFVTAIICGALLGIERERKDKPAGIRTMILITVGAALFMVVSELLRINGANLSPNADPSVDASRIPAQVVSGIGFLGAGVIIQSRGSVHGLTTAAAVWVAAAIGLCAGAGYHLTAFMVTGLVLAILIALRPMTQLLRRHGARRTLVFSVEDDSLSGERVRLVLEEHGVSSRYLSKKVNDQGKLIITVDTKATLVSRIRLIDDLAALKGVGGLAGVDLWDDIEGIEKVGYTDE